MLFDLISMRKRWIIVIVFIVLIVVSFFVPEVFLIFHFDKYETSKACDALKGEWDWFNDTCKINSDKRTMCEDIGGTPSCSSTCSDNQKLSPFASMFEQGCFAMCTFKTCEFIDPNIIKIK